MNGFNSFLCFPDAEAVADENVFVAAGVQFGEASAELKFIASDVDGAVGAYTFFLYLRG
jgi:hypothetical protein